MVYPVAECKEECELTIVVPVRLLLFGLSKKIRHLDWLPLTLGIA
jgi:hypothetical protein